MWYASDVFDSLGRRRTPKAVTRPVVLSARITKEAGALLDAMLEADPDASKTSIVEEGIKLVAKRRKVAGSKMDKLNE